MGGEKGALGAEMAQPCLPPPALRQQELLFHFLQLVSGVEHFQQKFRSQAAVIDEIVDTAFEVNQAGPGRSQMEGEGTGRPGPRRLCLEAAPSNSGVGLWEAEGLRHHLPPHPAGWRRGLQEVIPRVAARVQTSASGRLSPGSGQVPISAGKITGPAGLGPNRVLKPQVAPCPYWLGRGTREPVGLHACASSSVCVCECSR